MILRDIAESDYHYDASVVKGWTFYQLRQYVCEKKALNRKMSFPTLEAARAYAAEIKAKSGGKLKTFGFQKGGE